MLNSEQLRELIIRPALDKLQMYSDFASELLIFTCAVESIGGTYLKQIKGPALGIYQMEPATYNDIWQNYIRNRSSLSSIMGINFDAFRMPPEDRMIYDLSYATAMARIHYRRVNEPLPTDPKDIDALWSYYKKYYNTEKGKSKKEKSILMYQDFVR